MPSFLRIGFRSDRWLRLAWLQPGEVQADAVKDFNSIKNNELSVYRVDSEADALRAAVAIASKRFQDKAFGYALFDEAATIALGLAPVSSAGETPDLLVNSWHFEFQQLTFGHLAAVAKLIQHQDRVEEIPLPTFRGYVRRAVAAGDLNPTQVDQGNLK